MRFYMYFKPYSVLSDIHWKFSRAKKTEGDQKKHLTKVFTCLLIYRDDTLFLILKELADY